MGKSGAIYEVDLVLLAIYAGWRGHAWLAIILVALSAQLGLHNAFFIAPILFMGRHRRASLKLLLFLALYTGLTLWAFKLSKSKSFMGYVECTIGCHVFIHDLRPNIGLWWYMFIEMFDHFRPLFLGVFQLLPWAFIVPGATRLNEDPLMLVWFISAVLSVTKPYPTVADIGLSMQLLLLHPVLLDKCQKVLKVALIVGGAVGYLLPIVWYYWMIQGSGNSNFYYAATLAVNAVQMVTCVCVTAEYMKMQVESDNPEIKQVSGRLYQK